jgi:hypothetical protein
MPWPIFSLKSCMQPCLADLDLVLIVLALLIVLLPVIRPDAHITIWSITEYAPVLLAKAAGPHCIVNVNSIITVISDVLYIQSGTFCVIKTVGCDMKYVWRPSYGMKTCQRVSSPDNRAALA